MSIVYVMDPYVHIVTCTPIARQCVGKQVREDRFLVNSPLLSYATIDEAVFSIWSGPSKSRIMGLCSPFLSKGWVNTFPRIGPCYESGVRRCFPWRLLRVSRKLEE
jgi:hypothetical protein